MLFGKVSTLFLGLIASGLLARILSPEDMGIYVFIESIVLTAAIFSQLGLGLTSVKLVAHYTAKGDQVATQNTIFFILKLAGLGSIFTSFFLFFFGEKIGIPGSLMYWTGGWVVLVAMQQLFANIFRGFQDFRSVVLIDGSKIGGIITTSIAVVFLFFIWRFLGSLDLISVFPYLLIGGIPTLFFALLSLSKKIQIYTIIRNNQILNRREILTMAFPILVTTLTTTLLSRSGVWVATAFRIPSEVAVFGVIMRLVALISIPMNLFESLISPKIVELHTSGFNRKLENLLRSTTTLLSLFAVAIFIVFGLFGSNILAVIYGDFYRMGAQVLMVMIAGNAASVLTGPCGMTLAMTGHQKTLMRIDMFSSILSIILMLLLVQILGILGVAIAIAFSTLIKNVMMLFAVKKFIGIWTHFTLDVNQFMTLSLFK